MWYTGLNLRRAKMAFPVVHAPLDRHGNRNMHNPGCVFIVVGSTNAVELMYAQQ